MVVNAVDTEVDGRTAAQTADGRVQVPALGNVAALAGIREFLGGGFFGLIIFAASGHACLRPLRASNAQRAVKFLSRDASSLVGVFPLTVPEVPAHAPQSIED